MEDLIALRELVSIDLWLQVYLLFKLLDFVTGFLKAWKTEGFKSRKLRDGVIMVIGELVAIIFSSILDLALNLNFLCMATKILFLVKEGISIIENLGAINVNIPNVVKDKLMELKGENQKTEGAAVEEKEEKK